MKFLIFISILPHSFLFPLSLSLLFHFRLISFPSNSYVFPSVSLISNFFYFFLFSLSVSIFFHTDKSLSLECKPEHKLEWSLSIFLEHLTSKQYITIFYQKTSCLVRILTIFQFFRKSNYKNGKWLFGP